MCLFFFISGYFSPGSLDRKGRAAFLQDKFRRLGQPFVFFLFILGPLLLYFVQFASGHSPIDWSAYSPVRGGGAEPAPLTMTTVAAAAAAAPAAAAPAAAAAPTPPFTRPTNPHHRYLGRSGSWDGFSF